MIDARFLFIFIAVQSSVVPHTLIDLLLSLYVLPVTVDVRPDGTLSALVLPLNHCTKWQIFL